VPRSSDRTVSRLLDELKYARGRQREAILSRVGASGEAEERARALVGRLDATYPSEAETARDALWHLG